MDILYSLSSQLINNNMVMRINSQFFLVIISLLLAHNATGQFHRSSQFEFRGVWVATVTNIDWPSKKGLNVSQLKKEVQEILNLQQRLGMNSVILQVRPAGDAIFPSKLEPWSVYISGEQGKAPEEIFDPLQYWIDEAHKREIELHAWINPFRASLNITDSLHFSHPAKNHPEWTIKYGTKLNYDPGLEQVRQHLLSVIKDLIDRYDIDGIHMDDYFYPYPITGEIFNDSATYIQQLDFDAPLSIHDWRRKNINIFIESVSNLINEQKPWVRFGVSPFGVWRNQHDDERGSDTKAGVTCYDDLYADVLKWTDEGWLDYVAPQVYWSTQDEATNYIKLIKWWNQEVTNRDVYIGHGIYKINGAQPHWDNPEEVGEQIRLSRELPNVKGNIFYSHKHFVRDNNQLNKVLSENYFKKKTLTPPMSWKKSLQLLPVSNVTYKKKVLTWERNEIKSQNRGERFIIHFTPTDNTEGWWEITHNTYFVPLHPDFGRKAPYNVQVGIIDRWNNVGPMSESIKIRF